MQRPLKRQSAQGCRPPGAAGNKTTGKVRNHKDSEPTASLQANLYVASDIRRFRRTKTDIAAIRDAITILLEEDHPQTVRQIFYALTVRGIVRKAEGEYQRTVCRLLTEMREAGTIPFDWIADNTRWMRKPTTYSGLAACLRRTANFYRRDLWTELPAYVEVWCEKDALAGVLLEETDVYAVPLMVARGYASISFLHSAAETIAAKDKPTFIYHFGDLDPSGVDAARDIETKLRRYAPHAEIHFERVAVSREQVAAWNLPTRPTKTTDSRAAKFDGVSVELDAIPANKLRALVRKRIEQHVDQAQLQILLTAEESERETLAALAGSIGGAR